MTTVPSNSSQVSVQLSDCGLDDVETVFTALGGFLTSADEPADPDGDGPSHRPDVWTARYHVPGGCTGPAPVTLKGSVTAEVQGAPVAVDSLKRALGDAFTVSEVRSSSGDQEQQTVLRLESGAR